MKQTDILTHATRVNGWFPAVYMSCMSRNFRLFHVSNLSVRNFRIFLLMYTAPLLLQLECQLFGNANDIPTQHEKQAKARKVPFRLRRSMWIKSGQLSCSYDERAHFILAFQAFTNEMACPKQYSGDVPTARRSKIFPGNAGIIEKQIGQRIRATKCRQAEMKQPMRSAFNVATT